MSSRRSGRRSIVAAVVAELLTEHRLAPTRRRHHVADGRLGRPIGIGDEGEVRLRVDHEIAADEPRQCDGVGDVGQGVGEGQIGLDRPTLRSGGRARPAADA
jgi:hypothetical protein